MCSLVKTTALATYKFTSLRSMQRGMLHSGAGRSYPPTLLEQHASEEKRKMVLQFEFVDGRLKLPFFVLQSNYKFS